VTSAEHKAAAEEILADIDRFAVEMQGESALPDVVDYLQKVQEFALRRAQIHATLATIPDPAATAHQEALTARAETEGGGT
jgi:hypothetical protein